MTLHPFIAAVNGAALTRAHGYVRKVAPAMIEATGPAAALGDLCEIDGPGSTAVMLAEVVGAGEAGVVLVPLETGGVVRPGFRVSALPRGKGVAVGDAFAGRAVDALGRAIDGGKPLPGDTLARAGALVPRPLERVDPAAVLPTGIRAIDGLLTLARGQRVGIFAASGVGKTSLVEQLALQIPSTRCILCLVGERGREVEAFWRLLSTRPDRARYTLVAATSDESAALRARSVDYALSLAEYWRDRGEQVLLLVDSVTRLAMALREIGLAAGAPPTVRAYTPNVFSVLPTVVERCGALQSGGSITAIMTVLSETDDVDDPIVELMKSLLDGHFVLSRSLAEQGHFPALDVVRSVSRGADRLIPAAHRAAVRKAVAQLALYDESRVMVESGLYRTGSNAPLDQALGARSALNGFLRQPRDEESAFQDTVRRLAEVTGGAHD